MKSKVLCQRIEVVPESREPGSRTYSKAVFKRVGDTKTTDDETRRVMKEHPSVRVEFCTWGESPFVPGQEYSIEILPYNGEE